MPKPFRVVLLTNPWYECLEDTARLLALGLGRLTIELVPPEDYRASQRYRDIILGLHASPTVPIPSDAIIYQTEHPSTWSNSYAVQLQAHETWTYSKSAVGLLGHTKHVPLGYHPDFPTIAKAEEQDIDVLFFGSVNARRAFVLGQCERQGLNVHTAPMGTFGAELTKLIARAKVVLNVHYYTAPACFEYARVVPLVHSGVCVLSETSEDGEGTGLAAMATYENLANNAKMLVENKELREHCAKQSLKNLMKRPMADILKEVA